MVELTDLFNPSKRYLIGKKIINLNDFNDEILIKFENRILRCHINGVQQQTTNPFAYNDYNSRYYNQTTVPSAYSTTGQHFFVNSWQNSKINLDLCIYGEIRV